MRIEKETGDAGGLETVEWAAGSVEDLDELTEMLHAVVHSGGSINFVLPFSSDDARSFWTAKVIPAMQQRKRRVLVARAEQRRIVGSVQLNLDTPPNQAHRADVMKLMVHPDCQRQGLGRRLMQHVERLAGEERRQLLTLDTRAGDKGEQLYLSLGYIAIGTIPAYSKHPSGDELEGATFLYKRLPLS